MIATLRSIHFLTKETILEKIQIASNEADDEIMSTSNVVSLKDPVRIPRKTFRIFSFVSRPEAGNLSYQETKCQHDEVVYFSHPNV